MKLATRYVRMAWHTLRGRIHTDAHDRQILAELTQEPGFVERMAHFLSEVPQGGLVDRELLPRRDGDLRHAFGARLTGEGLELGALHRPLAVSSAATVRYVDRMTRDELRREYPSLAGLDLVETDILADASTLDGVPDERYDFVIAAHVLEHMRDPIGAIRNWTRVLKPGTGQLYLIVPDKRTTFDVPRVRTTVEHMVLDFVEPSLERDFDHYVDYATWVHLKRGRDAIDEARQLRDSDFSIHYHVFMPEDVVWLLRWIDANLIGLEIVDGPAASHHSDEFHVLVRRRARS
jgi:SAM-dependent methyltransferase